MLRRTVKERPDWQAIAEANGFIFHHVDGEIYWDERACWQFTLEEIENELAKQRKLKGLRPTGKGPRKI